MIMNVLHIRDFVIGFRRKEMNLLVFCFLSDFGSDFKYIIDGIIKYGFLS